MRSLPLIALFLAACGAAQSDRAGTGNPASQARDRTSAVAPERGGPGRAVAYTCSDSVLNDQLTSGGERLLARVTCWDAAPVTAPSTTASVEVRPNRIDDRETALASSELVQCKGISDQELARSPLQRSAIAQIVPHKRDGKLAGVRVVMKRVPGLTAASMEQAIACQRARYEVLGKPADYMPEDPTLVDDLEIHVTERGDHIEVLVTAPPAQASLALRRAQQLTAERTATR